ncbi:hypothetical protein [Paraburkholderia strydomiana]|uniref:hypothetical protein n=1 Tax=Paraburkholderia strydomiana TaxID=1245417 RepID=UPI0038BD2D92
MADLLRYIEQQFTVPKRVDAIELVNDSNLQIELRHAASSEGAAAAVREVAGGFLTQTFPTAVTNPVAGSASYQAFATQLQAMSQPTKAGIEDLVGKVLGAPAAQFLDTEQCRSDKTLLQNCVLAVKITTGFARADAALLVQSLRVIAFVEQVAAGLPTDLSQSDVLALFDRPVRVPANLLIATSRTTRPPGGDPGGNGPVQQLRDLAVRTAQLKATYAALMTMQAQHFEVHVTGQPQQPPVERADVAEPGHEPAQGGSAAAGSIVRISSRALEALPAEQRRVLDSLSVDVAGTPVDEVVAEVRRNWIAANQQLLPATVPGRSKLYRVGQHVFAQPDIPLLPMHTMSGAGPAPAAGPAPVPDFSAAITRPVGIGNLQLVRQELIGYEATEISHIENVLEGELFKRETRRTELTELTLTEELTTSQSQERDQQSTERNELANETQQEAGQQSSTSSGATSSSSYGKLVENSKSNYAQSTVQRAVESITSSVRQQRVQRERKTFVENAVHQLDNSKGKGKVRGIYQWVDKKYSMRVLNYGKRLMYDVVVPEPAAFLTQSLKDAVQPESFQLTKPADFTLTPDELDASNYMYYATTYGVTGAVTPPPDDFLDTVAEVNAPDFHKQFQAYGQTYDSTFFTAFKIHIPENYKAVSGYVQHTNVTAVNPGRVLDVYVGESTYMRFEWTDPLNNSFTMNNETGDIPVTMSSLTALLQLNYAVAINCQRTDKALEQWQLKTHAAIVSGYQRQLADYQDKLNRYVAAVRAQLAMSGNYAHDPTIERDELKKAFVFLLLGEQWSAYQPTPAPAPVSPPPIYPPDPTYLKQWGAMVAFFERAFEWENLMYVYYPYFWGRPERWEELVLTQDTDPEFEAFLKAGAARVVIPVRPGFEAALAHYQETGEIWLGEEIPDMFSDNYVSIISEIKAANYAPGQEVCVNQWEVTLPTTLIMLKDDDTLPTWKPTPCNPPPGP